MNELETESQTTRAEAAAYLRELADQLDAEGSVALDLGGQQATMDPTEPITLKLEAESDRSTDAAEAKESIEVELVWWRGAEPANAASE
jgi:amphi-Trp domain-containing protein